MRTLIDIVAAALVAAGVLNWGLVAVGRFDLAAAPFGLSFGEIAALTAVVYGLVAVAGLYQALFRKRTQSRSMQPASPHAAVLALAAAMMLQPVPARAQAEAPAPVRSVPIVDLDRYTGDWFEIARFPNRFQDQCVGEVRASYARRPDGRLDVVNRCRTADGQTEARGIARIVDEQTFAKLKVRFAPAWLSWLPAVWGNYWIIGLAADYSWAVVGDPGREYLWVLARAPHLDDGSVAAARAAARASGFAVERLVPTPQAGAGRP